MARRPEDVLEELLLDYGEAELERVRPRIGSSTLRAAARLVVERLGEESVASIFIPHYWAVYYHDGRGAFSAPQGRFLVFFPNPADDPRLEGGRPERAAGARRLTADEFRAGLDENQRRLEEGGPPYMIVVRSVGPAGAHPFFDELARGAAARMDVGAYSALDAYVQELLDEEGPERRSARARL
jgi:hypothetical protein